MPEFTVQRLADCLSATDRDIAASSILVLGLTYRSGVDETRASPGVAVARQLGNRAGRVYACDPVCTDAPPESVTEVRLDAVTEIEVDAVVLTTPHDAFDRIDWDAFDDIVIVDGHRAIDTDELDHHYYAIGLGHA